MVQSECYEATRILLYAKKIKMTTLFNNSSPLHQRSAILESIHCTQTAVLCQPRHTDKHWWQMHYFGDVFHTFLCLDSVIYLTVNGTVTSLPVFIQNILNCVPKTNEAFTGLERHGDKWLMIKFSYYTFQICIWISWNMFLWSFFLLLI